jgi:hypothetical protein
MGSDLGHQLLDVGGQGVELTLRDGPGADN